MNENFQGVSKSYFLVGVAKAAIASSLGAEINNWPPHNYWAMVSTIKSSIKDKQIPELMAKYKITKLSDFPPKPR